MTATNRQFDEVIAICKDLYVKKLHDYGPAWRIMRPSSITDQILIKAKRVRSLETKKERKVNEGIFPEFVGIVNYGIMGLIQMELGFSEIIDISVEQAIELYDKNIEKAKKLMYDKNHDYDEAWRMMRVSSYTDLILMKIYRTKEIESNDGQTIASEGIDANYMDMVNYAIFGLIKLHFGE